MIRFETMKLDDKSDFARELCRAAGDLGLAYFKDRGSLNIDQKGAQDWVSDADRNLEIFIRDQIKKTYPQDGIVGEEFGTTDTQSGFTWVIDPIDGTTNFVNGIPNWTIVLAGISDNDTKLGVIHDPIAEETFSALKGQGAALNGKPISVARGTKLASGSVAVGYSNRVNAQNIVPVIDALVGLGAMFHRNASGALSLAYVAAGRLLGYVEEHMNAWDCLAGQLLISEAGGAVEPQGADDMIRQGGRVIVGSPEVFDTLVEIADAAWQT